MKVRMALVFLFMFLTSILVVVSEFPKYPRLFCHDSQQVKSHLPVSFSAVQACGPDCGEIYQKGQSDHFFDHLLHTCYLVSTNTIKSAL